jgi:formylmethanofuran dehydrogenase subunit B
LRGKRIQNCSTCGPLCDAKDVEVDVVAAKRTAARAGREAFAEKPDHEKVCGRCSSAVRIAELEAKLREIV